MSDDTSASRLQTALALLTALESLRVDRLDDDGMPDLSSIPDGDALRSVMLNMIYELIGESVVTQDGSDWMSVSVTPSSMQQGVFALLELAHVVIMLAANLTGLSHDEIMQRLAAECRRWQAA